MTRSLRNLLPILAISVSATGLACQTAAIPPAAPTLQERLYVANQEAATVSIIDVQSQDIIETVDLTALGFTATSKPHHVVVEPGGDHWYVSLIADGAVLKFDRQNRLVGQAAFETPGMLALHPSQDLLYVGRSMAAVNPPQRIGEIRRSDMRIDELDVFFARPHAIAIDAVRNQVYSGSLAGNNIASLSVEAPEPDLSSLEGDPHVFVQFAVSPDGRHLVATGQLTGKLLVFSIADPTAPELIRTVDVGRSPWHPAFSRDGRYVYFGNQGSHSVMAVETRGWTVEHVIEGEGLSEPHGIAVSSDGRYVYVSNRNLNGRYRASGPDERTGTVVVIDRQTHAIIKVIEVGRYAAGMGIG